MTFALVRWCRKLAASSLRGELRVRRCTIRLFLLEILERMFHLILIAGRCSPFDVRNTSPGQICMVFFKTLR